MLNSTFWIFNIFGIRHFGIRLFGIATICVFDEMVSRHFGHSTIVFDDLVVRQNRFRRNDRPPNGDKCSPVNNLKTYENLPKMNPFFERFFIIHDY